MQRLLILLSMAFFILGCAPVYKTEYAYVPPASQMGQMCISQCIQNQNYCEQMCEMRNENCRIRAQQNASYQYENYRLEQERLGHRVKKRLDYFDNSYQCNNQCNCSSNYRTCYAACGGQVLERDVCVAFCDKR